MELAKLLVLGACGTLEGYAFVLTGVISPQAFRDQMEFKSFIIMKLFLSAVGTSMVVQGLYSFINPKMYDETRKYSKKSQGFFRAVSGCLILGAGMYICGSGPTMMPAQLSAGVETATTIVLGAFAGGLVFGLVDPILFPKGVAKCTIEQSSIDKKVNASYASLAVPLGFALLAATAALEYFLPHSRDTARITGFATQSPMLPIVAGAIIGLNQIPLRILAGSGQGGSTSVMTIIGTLSGGLLAPKQKLTSIIGAAQIVYVWLGTLLGGYYAAGADGAFRPAPGFGHLQTFVGALLMLFGARVADGCTCGHGITGMSELSLQSIAAAMSIFVGGIATGIVHTLAA